MEAVVLAAGRGRRLKPLTDDVPKPLIFFKGKPLIEQVCDTIFQCGVERIIVVVGYKGEQLEKHLSHLDHVDIVFNPDWRKGNATSLLIAEPYIESSHFVLSMADHLYPAELLKGALESYTGQPTLIIDRTPDQLCDIADATKVKIGLGNRVLQLGKNLDVWDAVDVGVFILPKTIFQRLDRDSKELSTLMNSLIMDNSLIAYDGSGANWVDLDSIRDLNHAEEILEWI